MSRFKQLLLIICVFALVITGCNNLGNNTEDSSTNSENVNKERYSASFLNVFDTVTQILGYDTSREEFDTKIGIIQDKLEYYHKLYDIYKTYEGINNIRTINENAGKEPVKVDQAIIDLLKFSIDLYDKTNGQTNIAMGSVLSIWHDYRTQGINNPSNASLPSKEELEEANKHTDITKIIIDEEASTVYLADSEMSLDVGSIGKGYAVQCVAEYARELGYNNYVLSVGGNIISIGPKFDNNPWRLGIQNPDLSSSKTTVATVDIVDLCLVTSGDYQRFYTVDEVEYCHIIDPDTLMPANHCKSVSIITANSGIADALSTAVFNMSFEEGLAFINNYDGAEAMWVLEDGSIKYSDNFEQYLVK